MPMPLILTMGRRSKVLIMPMALILTSDQVHHHHHNHHHWCHHDHRFQHLLDYNQLPDLRGEVSARCKPLRPTVRRSPRLDRADNRGAGRVAPGGTQNDIKLRLPESKHCVCGQHKARQGCSWWEPVGTQDNITLLRIPESKHCVCGQLGGKHAGVFFWILTINNKHAKSIEITFVQVGQVSATSLPVGVRSTQKSW